MKEFIDEYFAEYEEVVIQSRKRLTDDIIQLKEILIKTLDSGKKVYVFGNGGCSSIAQLMEAAFVGRYKSEKLSRSFISLSSDATVLTTLANDFGFENIYKKQLVAHLTPEDCVIGLSTSGNSQNVLNGIAYAKDQKAITIGGKLKDVADLCIRVPSNNPSFIEAVMSSIYSIICKTIE